MSIAPSSSPSLQVVARGEALGGEVAGGADGLERRRSRPRRRAGRRRRRGWAASSSARRSARRPGSRRPRRPSPGRRQVLGAGQQGRLLLALGAWRPACRAPSVRPAATRRRDRRAAVPVRGRPGRRPARRTPRGPPGSVGRGRGRCAAASGRSRSKSLSPRGRQQSLPRARRGQSSSGCTRVAYHSLAAAKSVVGEASGDVRSHPVGPRVGAEEDDVAADPMQTEHRLRQPGIAQVTLGVDARSSSCRCPSSSAATRCGTGSPRGRRTARGSPAGAPARSVCM